MGLKSLIYSFGKFVFLPFGFLVINVIKYLPYKPLRDKYFEASNVRSGMNETGMKIEDWVYTLGGWAFFKFAVYNNWKSLLHGGAVHSGGASVDVPLMNLVDNSACRLYDFKTDARPLVLSFGSCS